MGWLAVDAGLPPRPLERIRFETCRFSALEPDEDNLRASYKHVLDALVRIGVVVDDSTRHVELPTPRWQRIPSGRGRLGWVEIHVTQLEEI